MFILRFAPFFSGLLVAISAQIFDFPEAELTAAQVQEASEIRKKIEIRMSDRETALFLQYIREKKDTSYFEFGCGGSTMVSAAYGPDDLQITSVDSSQEWVDLVRKSENCEKRLQKNQLNMQRVDIGPIGAWGHPTQSAVEANGAWYLYSQAITEAGGKYDVVLVDGRFRIACTLNTFLSQPKAKVLIHDFLEPGHYQHYKFLLEVAEIANRAETLAELRVKPNVTRSDLMKMYAVHINNPMRRI